MAIPNLYQSFGHFWPFQIYTSLFGKNCWKKIRTAIFGHSKFIPVWEKLLEKNLEQPFLAIPNLYQSVWKNCWKKFRTAIFGHFTNLFGNLEKIPVPNFWEKLLEKIWNSHFWPFQIYTSLLGENFGKN